MYREIYKFFLIYHSQNIDIQYTVGVAAGVSVTFYPVGNDNNNGIFLDAMLDLANFLVSSTSIPTVLSESYGDEEGAASPALAK